MLLKSLLFKVIPNEIYHIDIGGDSNKWVKVFKNGPCKICGRQP